MNFSQDMMKVVQMACKSESTVLITGFTGTGKSSLARQIHQKSKRSSGPFIAINLATLNEGLLESELFGHEKGSFTGADRKRSGRLEMAQGGTVFLDEVGELSPRMQARLLEFLHSRTVSAVGSNRDIQLNVRVIAATHKDLKAAVIKGDFREDLFHRLRVVSIPLKALREREEDFGDIVHLCLQEICKNLGRSITRISKEVAEKFETYEWPGNIRELRNVLEYAVLASSGTEITLEDLPTWLMAPSPVESALSSGEPAVLGVAEIPMTLDFQATLQRLEKEYLKRALDRNSGRISRTAHQIGLNKTTLLRRIRAYGLMTSKLRDLS